MTRGARVFYARRVCVLYNEEFIFFIPCWFLYDEKKNPFCFFLEPTTLPPAPPPKRPRKKPPSHARRVWRGRRASVGVARSPRQGEIPEAPHPEGRGGGRPTPPRNRGGRGPNKGRSPAEQSEADDEAKRGGARGGGAINTPEGRGGARGGAPQGRRA